jgi:hypothetical protein
VLLVLEALAVPERATVPLEVELLVCVELAVPLAA